MNYELSPNKILKATYRNRTLLGLQEPKIGRQTITSLQEKPEDLINLQESDGENPLLVAAEHGNYEMLKAMVDSKKENIKNKFDTASCNKNDENVLHLSKFNMPVIYL